MKKIYLDNAATTAVRQEVIEEMVSVLTNEYGNPSSSHSFGRSAKSIIETSRKSIAKLIHCNAQEIIFTSTATEATNWIISSAVKDLGIQRIITSKVEHHATLYSIQKQQLFHNVTVDYVNILPTGAIDFNHLIELLSVDKKTLVSLMHINNETGVISDIVKIGNLCKQYQALFHCDTVQSVGKMEMNLEELNIDFLVASAHKFHGPKGAGFAYIKKNSGIQPLFFGGEQEKGLRAGTEAVHQIAGMAKALELSYKNLQEEKEYITQLKDYCIEQLNKNISGIKINGSNTLYNILNILLPFSEEKTAMILFNLDMKGIAISRGSACQSGSIKGSHVLAEMLNENDIKKPSIRISFSHYNTKDEIEIFINELKQI